MISGALAFMCTFSPTGDEGARAMRQATKIEPGSIIADFQRSLTSSSGPTVLRSSLKVLAAHSYFELIVTLSQAPIKKTFSPSQLFDPPYKGGFKFKLNLRGLF